MATLKDIWYIFLRHKEKRSYHSPSRLLQWLVIANSCSNDLGLIQLSSPGFCDTFTC